MADVIPPCPKCNCSTTYVNGHWTGRAEEHYDETGIAYETDQSYIHFESGGVVRCSDCTRIRRDLLVGERRVFVYSPPTIGA